MDATEIRTLFLDRLGLRLGPEMSAYVLRRLESGATATAPLEPIPVIGGDARTGTPVRQLVDLTALLSAQIQPAEQHTR